LLNISAVACACALKLVSCTLKNVMAEELYFFRFDKQKAKVALYESLNKPGDHSYEKYIRKEYNGDLKFNSIIKKVTGNIELITIDELWSLFNWFYEKNEQVGQTLDYAAFQKRLNDEMFANGLDLFFSIDSKTPVIHFNNYLINYAILSKTEIGHDCQAAALHNFLNYVICYAGELTVFLNINYYKHPVDHEENQAIQKAIKAINTATHSRYHKLALQEFNKNLSFYQETMQLVPALTAFRRAQNDSSPYSIPGELAATAERESELLNLAAQLYFAQSIKDKLAGYEGQVKLLHSY
jgi:hypothetical protein